MLKGRQANKKRGERFLLVFRCFGKQVLFPEALADGQEVIGLEGGTADQTAVHIFLGEDFGRVRRFARTAVEDGALSSGNAELVGQHLADVGMDFLCLLGCGGLCPNRGPGGVLGGGPVP